MPDQSKNALHQMFPCRLNPHAMVSRSAYLFVFAVALLTVSFAVQHVTPPLQKSCPRGRAGVALASSEEPGLAIDAKRTPVVCHSDAGDGSFVGTALRVARLVQFRKVSQVSSQASIFLTSLLLRTQYSSSSI